MDWTNPWITGPLCTGLGIVLGVLFARLLGGEGRQSKAIGELRAEFEEYREGVSQHFDTTSELFKDMTEKYRDVYNHMASGAQAFGATSDSPPRLEIVSDAEQIESASDDVAPATTDEDEPIDTSKPETAAADDDDADQPESEAEAELRRKADSPALEKPLD